MPIPHIELTGPQHRLLAELMFGDLPSPAVAPEAAAARGLAPEQVAEDLPELRWLQLISEAGGELSVTPLGAAVFHRFEQEAAEYRLAEVASFADALRERFGSREEFRRVPHTLRQLAQGVISLQDALELIS
jgi:hypothetical protein